MGLKRLEEEKMRRDVARESATDARREAVYWEEEAQRCRERLKESEGSLRERESKLSGELESVEKERQAVAAGAKSAMKIAARAMEVGVKLAAKNKEGHEKLGGLSDEVERVRQIREALGQSINIQANNSIKEEPIKPWQGCTPAPEMLLPDYLIEEKIGKRWLGKPRDTLHVRPRASSQCCSSEDIIPMIKSSFDFQAQSKDEMDAIARDAAALRNERYQLQQRVAQVSKLTQLDSKPIPPPPVTKPKMTRAPYVALQPAPQ